MLGKVRCVRLGAHWPPMKLRYSQGIATLLSRLLRHANIKSMSLIVIPDDAPPVLSRSDAVRQLRDCAHRVYPTLPADSGELMARIAGADAVINIRSSTLFAADVLAGCPA